MLNNNSPDSQAITQQVYNWILPNQKIESELFCRSNVHTESQSHHGDRWVLYRRTQRLRSIPSRFRHRFWCLVAMITCNVVIQAAGVSRQTGSTVQDSQGVWNAVYGAVYIILPLFFLLLFICFFVRKIGHW